MKTRCMAGFFVAFRLKSSYFLYSTSQNYSLITNTFLYVMRFAHSVSQRKYTQRFTAFLCYEIGIEGMLNLLLKMGITNCKQYIFSL